MTSLKLRNVLLTGTAVLTVAAFMPTIAQAQQDQKTTAGGGGAVDWSALADGPDLSGANADTVVFGAADTLTVDDGEDIGDGNTAPGGGLSVDAGGFAGILEFDGGDTDATDGETGSIVYGDIDPAAAGGGDQVTINVGTAGGNGAAVSFFGDIGAENPLNVVGDGTSVVTFGNGTDAMDAASAIDLSTDVNGTVIVNLETNSTISGTVTDTAAATAMTINVNGASTISGDVDLADSNANVTVDDGVTLTLSSANFDIGTGVITLGDADTTEATLLVNGTGVQEITAVIDGDAEGNGNISVTNAVGTVNFNSAVGAGGQLASFTLATGANVVTDAALDSALITLNDNAGELQTDGAVTATTITIGANATLDSNSTIDATTINVNEDGTLDQAGALITSNIVNNGTLTFSTNGAGVTGNITGTGTMNVNAGTTVTGSVAADTINIQDTDTLTIVADSADTLAADTIVINDLGTDAGLILDADGGNSITTSSLVTTGAGGNGALATAGSGTVTINNDIGEDGTNLGLFDVGDADDGNTEVTGNVYADATVINSGSTLTLSGDGVSVAGTVAGGGIGEGNLVVADDANVTFDGVIGGGVNTIRSFVIGDGATANISQDVSLTHDDGVSAGFDLDGTMVVDTTGNNVTLTDAAGIFALDGTLTTAGNGTNTLTLGSAGTIHAGWNDTAAQMNAGNQVILDNDFIVGDTAGDTYTILADRTADFDTTANTIIDANGNAFTVAADSVARFGLGTTTVEYVNGDSITFVDNAGGGTDFAAMLEDGRVVFLGQTAMIGVVDGGSDANTLVANYVANDASTVFTSGSTGVGVANALANYNGATGDLATIRTSLLTETDSEEAEELAESLAPEVSGGAQFGAAVNVTNTTTSNIGARVDGDAGIASGNFANGGAMWFQAFGTSADQDDRDGVDGYEADTFGGTVGFDTGDNMNGSLLGLAFTYGNTDVESSGVNATDSDIDTYQVALYGNMELPHASYMTGTVGYGWNEIDQSRYNVAGTAGNTASAEYDSDTFFANAEYGRALPMSGGLTITPTLMANYIYLDTDSYTESGSTANLTVGGDDLSIFELGVGADFDWRIDQADGSVVKPNVNVAYHYDFVGDEVATTSSFTAGGPTFTTQGFDPAQSRFNIGTGVTWESNGNWDLSAAYDYELKEDYDAHSGMVRARYNW